jgi:Family of unknown function (DUF6345)
MRTLTRFLGGIAFLGLLTTIVSLTPGTAEAQREAKMYAITVWNAGCPGGTRDDWDNMVDAWYDEITNRGFSIFGLCITGHCGDAYLRDGRSVNGNIANSWFADASVVSWGNDTPQLDDGDAVMIGTHGADAAGVWSGTMRVDEAGDGDCMLRRDEMGIGDADLEFLHLSSCNSMDANQWSSWWRAFDGAHQVDGFHGFMWIGPDLISRYRNFASDAFDGAISDAWLDNHYVPDIANGDDQCPVAYAVGADEADVTNRLRNERYNNVFSDPTTIGWWAATYMTPCDPQNEDPL